MKAGNVGLIKLPNKTRPYRQLGRILELIYNHNNNIRCVKQKEVMVILFAIH